MPGLLLGCIVLVCGGRAALRAGAIEVTFRERLIDCHRSARALPFRGIVFGHVILAVTAEELTCIRAHERVHVAQYERWGLLFFVAYPLSSLLQLLRGRHPYRDNHFEVEARAHGAG
ncbi:MAG TPA: hypothetical protein VGE69_02845 [Pseudomonadales bacterium]